MTDGAESGQTRLIDANVLIDFFGAGHENIFELVIQQLGVSLQVGQLTYYEVSPRQKKGVRIVESQLENLGVEITSMEASEEREMLALKAYPLSDEDKENFVIAKSRGYSCVTNDIPLQKKCKRENVPYMWGTYLLVELYKCGVISKSKAIRIAKKIIWGRRKNPQRIMKQFMRQLKD